MWSPRFPALACLILAAMPGAGCSYDWSGASGGSMARVPVDGGARDAGDQSSKDAGPDEQVDAGPGVNVGGTCADELCGPHASACYERSGGFSCECAEIWTGNLCEQQQPLMITPASVAVDAAGTYAIVILDNSEWLAPVLLHVDLRTGLRRVISGYDPQTGGVRGRGRVFGRVWGIELDEARRRALMLDLALLALVSIDLDTGERKVLSDNDDSGSQIGEGPAFVEPRDLALDLAHGRVLVSDSAQNAVLAVDLASGKRSVFSAASFGGAAIGQGADIPFPSKMALDAGRDRLLLIAASQKVFAIDLLQGDRRLLSDGTLSPALKGLSGVAVDAEGNRALLLDGEQNALFSMNLSTGERTLLSLADPGQPTLGAGPTWKTVVDIALDVRGKRAILADIDADFLSTVDLASGDRAVLGRNALGSGPSLICPFEAIADSARKRWLVADGYDYGRILTIAADTGARAVLSGQVSDGSVVGAGPPLRRAFGLALDTESDRLFAYDILQGAIFAIALGTGDRSILSSADYAGVPVGAGPSLQNAQGGGGLVLDRARGRLLASGQNGELLAIDLVTGDRSVFFGAPYVALNLRLSVQGDLLYTVGTHAYGDAWGLLEVDLATSTSRMVSGLATSGQAIRGTGPVFEHAGQLAISADGTRAFVVGLGLIEIDMATGDRRFVSGLREDREIVGKGAFGYAAGLMLDEANQRMFAIDTYSRAMVSIDLNTGDRTLISLGEAELASRPRY